MRNWLCLAIAVFISISAFAQNSFQGTFLVDYKFESSLVAETEVIVKDSMVYLKTIKGGISKYDHFILNLKTNEFFAVSTPGKKVIIKYDANRLMELYETEKLKEDYKRNTTLTYRATEENKEMFGYKAFKYTGEDKTCKASLWLANTSFNFNQLIPLLRLMDNWNEAQTGEGTIVFAEVENLKTKAKTSVNVVITKGDIAQTLFDLPKNYLQQDFSKIVEEQKKNKSLKNVIQAFAGF